MSRRVRGEPRLDLGQALRVLAELLGRDLDVPSGSRSLVAPATGHPWRENRPILTVHRRSGTALWMASITRLAMVLDGSGPRWSPLADGFFTTARRGQALSTSSLT